MSQADKDFTEWLVANSNGSNEDCVPYMVFREIGEKFEALSEELEVAKIKITELEDKLKRAKEWERIRRRPWRA